VATAPTGTNNTTGVPLHGMSGAPQSSFESSINQAAVRAYSAVEPTSSATPPKVCSFNIVSRLRLIFSARRAAAGVIVAGSPELNSCNGATAGWSSGPVSGAPATRLDPRTSAASVVILPT